MTWTKLDDGFPRHPKVLGLSDRAFRLHIEALCLCSEHLTDGAIPDAWVRRQSTKAVGELVAAGLWDAQPYAVHDYLDYNLSRADVEGSREQARERMRDVRANFDDSSLSPSRPVPVQTTSSSKALVRQGFENFWRSYPRRVGKRTAESAFERACARAPVDEIVAAAASLAADPNLPEERFIPHPTTWLNRDGWEDGPLPPRTGGKARSVSNILALADGLENR